MSPNAVANAEQNLNGEVSGDLRADSAAAEGEGATVEDSLPARRT